MCHSPCSPPVCGSLSDFTGDRFRRNNRFCSLSVLSVMGAAAHEDATVPTVIMLSSSSPSQQTHKIRESNTKPANQIFSVCELDVHHLDIFIASPIKTAVESPRGLTVDSVALHKPSTCTTTRTLKIKILIPSFIFCMSLFADKYKLRKAHLHL